MAATKEGRERKVVVTVPDMGLTRPQLTALKRTFKNEVTSAFRATARTDIVIVVQVEIVF